MCLTAFTFVANAQQQTTQKAQSATPATPTSELKKNNDDKRTREASTLSVTERNAAARRHKDGNANGASPNLNDSRDTRQKGGSTSAENNANSSKEDDRSRKELQKPQQNGADGARRSTGKRENSPNAAE